METQNTNPKKPEGGFFGTLLAITTLVLAGYLIYQSIKLLSL
jgi:hypothetical protein